MDAIGIAPQFTGISVHDALPSYQGYRSTEALCNVHHLRDLTFIEEELKQEWAKDMKVLLLDMKEAVAQACARGQPELETVVLAVLLTRYDQIVQAGYQINPLIEKPPKTKQYKRLPGRPKQSPARNLLDRFSTRRWDVLRFLLDFTVPFDKVIEGIADRAGVPQFTTHTLRHLCLTDLARADWDLHEIATFAGHRNPQTTLLYIHLSGRDLAKKLEQGMAAIHTWRVQMLAEVLQ